MKTVYPFAKWSALLLAAAWGGVAQPVWALPTPGPSSAPAQGDLALPVEDGRAALPAPALSAPNAPHTPRGGLTTDLIEERGMIALGHGGRATPVNQRFALATVRYAWRVGAFDPRGNPGVALDFQHGATTAPEGGDFMSRPHDHYSFTLTRTIYLGASAALPVGGGVGFFAGAGALRNELRDNFATGDAARGRDVVLHGWRMAAGVEKRLPRGVIRAEYRISSARGGASGGESLRLAGETRGRLMVSFSARFD